MLELIMPIHQKLIHFPIALFICAFIFQLGGIVFKKISLRTSAWFMYVFSVVFTPIVVVSGLWQAKRANLHHPIVESHEFWGLTSMITAIILIALIVYLRKDEEKNKYFIAAVMFIIVMTVTITGHFGGLIEV